MSRMKIAASVGAVAASFALLPGAPSVASTTIATPSMNPFTPAMGHLVMSETDYTVPASRIVDSRTVLPGCTPAPATSTTPAVTCKAIADAGYPEVFNNDTVDGSFGITTPLSLQTLTTSGAELGSYTLPNDPSADRSDVIHEGDRLAVGR